MGKGMVGGRAGRRREKIKVKCMSRMVICFFCRCLTDVCGCVYALFIFLFICVCLFDVMVSIYIVVYLLVCLFMYLYAKPNFNKFYCSSDISGITISYRSLILPACRFSLAFQSTTLFSFSFIICVLGFPGLESLLFSELLQLSLQQSGDNI